MRLIARGEGKDSLGCDIGRQEEEGEADKGFRPPSGPFIFAVALGELPEVLEKDTRGEDLDKAVQAEAHQGDAAGRNAATDGDKPLGDVVEEGEDEEAEAIADEGWALAR